MRCTIQQAIRTAGHFERVRKHLGSRHERIEYAAQTNPDRARGEKSSLRLWHVPLQFDILPRCKAISTLCLHSDKLDPGCVNAAFLQRLSHSRGLEAVHPRQIQLPRQLVRPAKVRAAPAGMVARVAPVSEEMVERVVWVREACRVREVREACLARVARAGLRAAEVPAWRDVQSRAKSFSRN